ncbi:MAG: winged helix DNA-binding protein [Magnetococcales bacterium]|nr:winged helix DNA-binding protein [Magnetococcales bacterium]
MNIFLLLKWENNIQNMPRYKTGSHQNPLVNQLTTLGLTQQESIILIALLQLGRDARSGEIAQAAHVDQSGTHKALSALHKKGLVSKLSKGAGRGWDYFFANDPRQTLPHLVDRQSEALQRELEQKRALADPLAGLLNQMERQEVTVPEVRFFEGIEGLIQIHEDIAATAQGEVFSYLYDTYDKEQGEWERFQRYFRKNYEPKVIKRGLKFRTIFPPPDKQVDSFSQVSNRPGYEARYLSKGEQVTASFVATYDDKTILFSFEGRKAGLIIKDETIAKTHRWLLEEKWENAVPVGNKPKVA